MNLSVLLTLALTVLAVAPIVAAEGAREEQSIRNVRFRSGDDSRWVAPGWDDGDWMRAGSELYLPVREGVYWVRIRVPALPDKPRRQGIGALVAPENRETLPTDAVFIAGPCSFELFWDGRSIWRNGVVGADPASEIPGRLDNLVPIPADLLGPGGHVVAVRISNWNYNFSAPRAGFYIALENYAERLVYETRAPILPLAGASAAAVAAAVCVALHRLTDRRRSLLVCGALSLSVALFCFLIAWRWLHNDTYDWFAPRLIAITCTVTLICGLQAWLLLELFAIPRRGRWLAALAPLVLAAWFSSPYHAVIVLWIYRSMLVFSIVAAGWAMWRGRTGARWVLAGALIGLVSVQLGWDNRGFVSPAFLGAFGVQLLGLLVSLGVQVGEDRRQARAAVLTAARLEIELLKKNIQPHFLMNTLTTIMEVIEQEPKSAVALIEALAGEFRILARVSAEKLIPLGQELELCRAHIRIMSLRRGVACALETEGLGENTPVPPALFHTLIEGGLTHQRPRNGELKFTLAGEVASGASRYTLIAHGENPPQAGPPPKDGTGLRYVKARLEESFAGRWSLHAGPVAEGWRTVIEIGAPGGKVAT